MQRVLIHAAPLHRLASSSSSSAVLSSTLLSASAASSHAVLAAWQHATAATPAAAQQRRWMSAGSKRDNQNGIPFRRAGGMKLPDDDHTLDSKGRERYKSARQTEAEEAAEEARELREQRQADGEVNEKGERLIDTPYGKRTEEEFEHGSKEDQEAARELRGMLAREPLREGEQLFRERTFQKSGIKAPTQMRQKIREDLKTKPRAKSSATKHNPVLIRTRAHLDSIDLPAAFDHFKVPALTAHEVDEKTKALHATYWERYEGWKEARPEEYARWLERLKQREKEQEYHWQRSQGVSDRALKGISQQSVRTMLPEKHRESFLAAMSTDSALKDAVEKLGEDEVLRRWSAYQVFLDAEIAATDESRTVERKTMLKLSKDRALNAEDTLETINNPDLSLNLPQKKKLYHMLTAAKRRVAEEPFWTDPDPRFEGEHDWKMADAFLKPPLLPPLHLLKHYPARPSVNSNFSSLHKFLHFERLRQTMHFVREEKKKMTRIRKRAYQSTEPLLASLLEKTPKEWSHIQKAYPFLSDALLKGVANLYRAPWAPSDKMDFVKALHRNVLIVARLLDVHFQRRNRNADWILPFPNAARTNPDEILRPMSRKQVTQMEAELLAGRMMEVLSEEQPGEAERRTQAQQAAEDAPRAAAEAGAAQQ